MQSVLDLGPGLHRHIFPPIPPSDPAFDAVNSEKSHSSDGH